MNEYDLYCLMLQVQAEIQGQEFPKRYQTFAIKLAERAIEITKKEHLKELNKINNDSSRVMSELEAIRLEFEKLSTNLNQA